VEDKAGPRMQCALALCINSSSGMTLRELLLLCSGIMVSTEQYRAVWQGIRSGRVYGKGKQRDLGLGGKSQLIFKYCEPLREGCKRRIGQETAATQRIEAAEMASSCSRLMFQSSSKALLAARPLRTSSARLHTSSPRHASLRMNPSTGRKVTNLSFYLAFAIACCTVSFSTLLPCPARKTPYASAEEMPQEAVQSEKQEGKRKGGKRKWLQET
jgi:hypothetical protein